jgi:diacylglycerol kinase (ATP)
MSTRVQTEDEKDFSAKGVNGRGIGRIVRALGISFAGLRQAARTEAAFRQEAALAAVLIVIALVIDVTGIERALMIASVMAMLIVELLNSALETTLDRISQEFDPAIKAAKDMGSAAVFLSIVTIAVVWICILAPRGFAYLASA